VELLSRVRARGCGRAARGLGWHEPRWCNAFASPHTRTAVLGGDGRVRRPWGRLSRCWCLLASTLAMWCLGLMGERGAGALSAQATSLPTVRWRWGSRAREPR